jgi:hypothetical protein
MTNHSKDSKSPAFSVDKRWISASSRLAFIAVTHGAAIVNYAILASPLSRVYRRSLERYRPNFRFFAQPTGPVRPR